MDNTYICECGGLVMEWQRGIIYPACEHPERITWRCVRCGNETDLPPALAARSPAAGGGTKT